MKLLIVDQDNVGLAFAWRCARAGHQVKLFIKPSATNHVDAGDGFKGVEKVQNWVAHAQWADLIWCTSNCDYLPRLEFFRKKGVHYFGPSQKSAELEIKRGLGMKFLEKHGIECPPFEQFASLQDAEKHVWKTGERFVFKTLGDNENKALSYVAKSPADLIARLRYWQQIKMNPKGPVMLQQFIKGQEFAVSRWMGSDGWVGPYNENFEHKKLLSGNAGPNCGEAGTVQKYVKESKLGDEVLGPLEEALLELGHMGDIDVNCIIDESGKAWPLEFTCRPGWPAYNIMLAEHRGDPVEWMLAACKGEDELEVSHDIACGVVLAQPDYPYSNLTKKETTGIPVYGVTSGNQKYLQPQCLKVAKMPDMDGEKIVERDIWVTAGDYLAVVTGTGKTVRQACERAYKTVKEIDVPDMIWRDDIGEKLKEEIPALQKHGYATEFTYGEA